MKLLLEESGKRMRIAIVDDVYAEREILQKYISEWSDEKKQPIEFVCFESSESFLFSWETDKNFELLILDIEMGAMNGLELAKKLRAAGESVPIMFVTGYDEYMQYGYDLDALHYLIKPVQKNRLFTVLDKLEEKTQKEVKCFLLHSKDEMKRVQLEELMYVEANGHGSVIHTKDATFEVREAFGSIERLATVDSYLVKCHRAYLVNLRFCAAMKNENLILDNEEMIPISRNIKKNVQTQFLKYYGKQKEI